jgi:hypothetical protein
MLTRPNKMSIPTTINPTPSSGTNIVMYGFSISRDCTLKGDRPVRRYNVSNALEFASTNHRLRNKRNSPPQIARMDHSTSYMRTASSPLILLSVSQRTMKRTARLSYIMPCIVPCTCLSARQQARQNSFHHSAPSCHTVGPKQFGIRAEDIIRLLSGRIFWGRQFGLGYLGRSRSRVV